MAGFEAFKIFGSVVLDAKPLESSLNEAKRKTDDFSSDLGKTLGSLGKTMSVALTVPITAFAVKSVAAFEEHQRAAAQTSAVLKSTGNQAGITADQIDDLTKSLGKKAAVDDDLVRSGANVLLTFTNIRDEVGAGNDIFSQATTVALDLSAALGTDMAGAATIVGKALNAPVEGLAALTRVGVQFTEQQKDQIKQLVSSGDLLGAQGIILDQLRTKFEGSAEAQVTATARMKVAFDDLAETFGAQLAPFLTSAADSLDNIAQKFIEMGPEGQQAVALLAGAAALAGPLLGVAASFATISSAIMAANIGLGAFLLTAAEVVAFAVLAGIMLKSAWDLGNQFAARGDLPLEGLTGDLLPTLEQVAAQAETATEAISGMVAELEKSNNFEKTKITNYTFAVEQMEMAFQEGKVSAEEAAGVIDSLMPQALKNLGYSGEKFVDSWIKDMAKIPETAELAQASMVNFAGLTGQELLDWEQKVAGSIDIVGDALHSLSDDANLTAAEIVQAFRDQLNAQRDFRSNVFKLSRMGLSEPAAMELLARGAEEAGDVVAGLLKGTAEDIKAFNRTVLNSSDEAIENSTTRTILKIAGVAAAFENLNAQAQKEVRAIASHFAGLASSAEDMATRIYLAILKILEFGKMGKIDLAISARIAKNAREGIVPAGASGALVSRPTLALIGEAGPEAVVPLNQMPGASPLPAGGGSNLTVNVVLDRKTFARQQDYYSRASGL